jgi:hypothetical protein
VTRASGGRDTGVRGDTVSGVTRASGGRDTGVRGDTVSGVTRASGVITYSLQPARPVPVLIVTAPSLCSLRKIRCADLVVMRARLAIVAMEGQHRPRSSAKSASASMTSNSPRSSGPFSHTCDIMRILIPTIPQAKALCQFLALERSCRAFHGRHEKQCNDLGLSRPSFAYCEEGQPRGLRFST